MQQQNKIINIKNQIEDFCNKKNITFKKVSIENIDLSYEISTNNQKFIEFIEYIKNHDSLKFDLLTDLFATDYIKEKNIFEISYNLLSLKNNKRLMLKIPINEKEEAMSITKIYSCSVWYEREIFDMFGIKFNGLKDHRRILTDYNFEGHPLRKDFPLTGKYQIKYDTDENKIIREDVSLLQEYREFNFESSWKGYIENNLDKENIPILPGDEKASK
ncbi:MAG TPA: NADH-quinone oxidoreductase subunit C [Candidatus Megaira endosymbiont of Hartmannula sinica]|nr:NADH-quinone oxidoreductase subunit C [Candidatus Megaera endosymbiont of Hartmannula sinica]